MSVHKIKSNLILLLVAIIWGFAFVAQREGIKYIGPFTFNGIRFALGSISLIPLMLFNKNMHHSYVNKHGIKRAISSGILAGIILFSASSLQQIGLLGTTAGKAGFITGLYIVLVPILGIILKQYIGINGWLGAIIATIGLYLLCVTDRFSISYYDLLELIGSLLFAIHILLIDRFSLKVDTLKLAFFQFLTCSVLSMAMALFMEKVSLSGIHKSIIPILYGGVFSVGIAYTLQIVGQKNANPSHAAIILSFESVFAVIGGTIILNENLGLKGFLGCAFMFTGMLLSQFRSHDKKNMLSDSETG
ncbi:DMT family transporter [Clostridium akagii]|uniref:DMT family transporter n=1 Tax=Clostridium akagii TaxID=91623 RepID=UPI00047BA27A|nr:DMT family transporter [Clostridium akagii]